MKLKTSMLIAALVVSSMVQSSDNSVCDDASLRLRCRSVGPLRSKVVLHHDDLLVTIVGKEDKASQRLSYTPRVDRYDKHIATPRSLGRRNLLPIVHRGQDVVHLLGTKMAPNSKSAGVVLQKPKAVVSTEKSHQEKFEDAVRLTILAFARDKALTQLSSHLDGSHGQ